MIPDNPTLEEAVETIKTMTLVFRERGRNETRAAPRWAALGDVVFLRDTAPALVEGFEERINGEIIENIVYVRTLTSHSRDGIVYDIGVIRRVEIGRAPFELPTIEWSQKIQRLKTRLTR